jgi:hypothetical protein
MKSLVWVIALLALAMFCFAQNGEHSYAGVKKCKMCHKGEKNGNIYETWESSAHSKAFEILGSDAAKAVYTKSGKTGNPQEDGACLKCHITGFGVDTSRTADLVKEDGIGCESCHGAGGDYFKKATMVDHDLSVASGLNPDPKTACISCHNAASPTHKEFVFEERWAKIKHARPAAAPAGE